MKTITKTVYVAHDGKAFDTAEECKSYERDNIAGFLYGLTEDDIDGAIARTEGFTQIADAIEQIGALIAKKRREQGDLRRRRKGSAITPRGNDQAVEDAIARDDHDNPDIQAIVDAATDDDLPVWEGAA